MFRNQNQPAPRIRRWGVWLCLISLAYGVAGETLLFLHEQCRQVKAALLEDFRVVAFINTDLGEIRQKVVEEKLRALPGVIEARLVSRDAALEHLKARDPELVQSIALLGENPLPAAFEVRLEPEAIADLPVWVNLASKVPEVSDIRFKPLETHAILQMEFYNRFLNLAMSLAAAAWLLAAASGLWLSSHRKHHRPFWKEVVARITLGTLGSASGMALVFAAAYPLRMAAQLWTWPSWGDHAFVAVVGALGACFWPEEGLHLRNAKGLEKRYTSEVGDGAEAAEIEDVTADIEG